MLPLHHSSACLCTNADISQRVVFKPECCHQSRVGYSGLDHFNGNICSHCGLPHPLSKDTPQGSRYFHRLGTVVQVSLPSSYGRDSRIVTGVVNNELIHVCFFVFFARALLFFRQIRPVRVISLVPSMRQVLDDVLLGWKKLLQAAVLLSLFIFMFASLGVQLFAGVGSPQGFCNDISMISPEDCVGMFDINIDISPQELLSSSENDISIHVPRVW